MGLGDSPFNTRTYVHHYSFTEITVFNMFCNSLSFKKTEAIMLYALGRRCFTALMMGVVMTPQDEGRKEAGPLLA